MDTENTKTLTSEKFKKILNICSNILLVIALTIAILFACSLGTEKPSVLGYRCLWVASGSMEPVIHENQYIFCKVTDGDDVAIGDIVAYKKVDDITGIKKIIVHRIIDIYEEEGNIYYIFKGDNNELQDEKPVKQEMLMYKVIGY